MHRLGYARINTTDQDLAMQVAKLQAEGCDTIGSEKVRARRDGTTELATAREFLRRRRWPPRLDRLGRGTRDVLDNALEAEQRHAVVTVLDPHVSTRGDRGQVVRWSRRCSAWSCEWNDG